MTAELKSTRQKPALDLRDVPLPALPTSTGNNRRQKKPQPEASMQIDLAARKIELGIVRGTVTINWEQLPAEFRDARYLLPGRDGRPEMLIWLTTLHDMPGLRPLDPAQKLTGVVLHQETWRKILEDKLLPPWKRDHEGPSYLYLMAPNMITLERVADSESLFRYAFARNEGTGNFGAGVSTTVELRFPKIDPDLPSAIL